MNYTINSNTSSSLLITVWKPLSSVNRQLVIIIYLSKLMVVIDGTASTTHGYILLSILSDKVYFDDAKWAIQYMTFSF